MRLISSNRRARRFAKSELTSLNSFEEESEGVISQTHHSCLGLSATVCSEAGDYGSDEAFPPEKLKPQGKKGADFRKLNVVIDNKSPRRATPPFLVVCAAGLWVSCAASFYWSRQVLAEIENYLVVAFFVLLIVSVLASFLKRFRRQFLVVSFLVLGMLLGVGQNAKLYDDSNSFADLSGKELYATLVEDSSVDDYGVSAVLDVDTGTGKNLCVNANFSEGVSLLNGEKIVFTGTFKSIKAASRDYYFNKGICCQVKVSKFSVADSNLLAFIISARKTAIENFEKHSGSTAGLLQALVCGYRDTIRNDGTYEAFRTCGLAHVVAVSGAHLAIVTATFMLLLKKLRVSRKLTAVITTVMVLCYLVFAGIPISAIRAACMVVLGLLAGLFGRRANPLNALALCVIVIIVTDPTASMSISLLLSTGSTFGIILFARLFESWFDAGRGKVNSFLVQPTSLTLSSNLMTLPISAAIFSQVSTIALIANIIATPLFSLACVLGLVAASVSCVLPPLAAVACGLASFAAYPLHFATTAMSKIPFACIAVQFDVIVAIILSAILVLLLLGFWPHFNRKQIAAGCCAVLIAPFLFVFISPFFTPDRIVFLDVGQGDAILIQSTGKNVLIDTGNQSSKLKIGLAKRGVFKLDAIIVTHHDDDNMGCLQALSEYENVSAVYSAEEATTCKCDGCGELRSLSSSSCGGDLKGLSVGDKIRVGKFTCEVVWPDKFTDEGGNSDSLSLLISSDINSDGNSEMTLLTTGDAESESIDKMISEHGLSQVDVLKVAHHGSKVSLDDKLLDSLEPRVGVISVGANNRYGHPKQETLDYLAKHDVKSLRTDERGSITITPNSSSFSVTTES